MKCLITGDKGFIGTQMTRELKSRGWDVYGYDVLDLDDAIDYFRDTTENEYFDLVVHCAYVVGGRETIDGTNLALAHNVQLDGALFEWGLRASPAAIIYFSSSAAYPVEYQSRVFNKLLDEDDIYLPDPGTPDANYGWAKLTGERVASSYAAHGGRVHILRPFSGYSEEQSHDYPFTSIVGRVVRGDYSAWGPAGQTRDWIHGSDVINGALEIYNQDVRDPVNLCTGVDTSFGELIQMVHLELEGTYLSEDAIRYDEDKPTGVFYRVGNPARLHNYYNPKVSIEEGIYRALTH